MRPTRIPWWGWVACISFEFFAVFCAVAAAALLIPDGPSDNGGRGFVISMIVMFGPVLCFVGHMHYQDLVNQEEKRVRGLTP